MKIKRVENQNEKFAYTEVKTQKGVSGIELKDLYKHAHEELSLQQSKRDQIISLYITICSLLLPISFSIEKLANIRGYLFVAIGLIGFLLSGIINRYRVYKEVYWLACISISRLFDYKPEEITKDLVQSIFYDSMVKKGGKVTKCIDGNKFHSLKFYWSLHDSAETLYYVLETVVASAFIGVGLYLILSPIDVVLALAISIPVFILFFINFYIEYGKKVLSVYKVLLDGSDKSFNKTFSKAWFMYIY